MRFVKTGIYIVLMVGLILPVPSWATTKPYQMGVFPFLPARELENIFAPMAASLSQALSREVQFRSSLSYRNFMERSDSQLYDIAFVQPFDYVRLADKHNYIALAARGEKLSAILVVKQDSAIKTINDLKGKVLALPPDVAAVSRLSKAFLKEKGVNLNKDMEIRHTRSHVSCMQQVLVGLADACGTAAPPIRFFENKMKMKFRKLAHSRSIPHTLYIVNKRLPVAVREKIRETILSWSKSEEGLKLLKRGRMKPFVAVEDQDYDIIREILKTLEK